MKRLLVYYGWVNSFNSGVNQWNNEKVAQDMARYGTIVLGNGVQESTHGDYSNTSVIIPRIKEINPDCEIFGYVSLNQAQASFKTKVNEWEELGVDGIFFDEAGYDYGSVATNGREAFNQMVGYVHAKEMKCFINAWKIEHVLSNETSDDDVSYPNATYNPQNLASELYTDDIYMLESFGIKSDKTYESKTSWLDRGTKARQFEIRLASLSCIDDADVDGNDKMKFVYVSAMMWELDMVGASDTNYGASSAKSKMWPVLKDSILQEYETANPAVLVDAGDSDLYMKYCGDGKLEIDFSIGQETSTVTNYGV